MYQEWAWIITLICGFFLFLVFGIVAWKSGGRREYASIQSKAYRIRKYYFQALLGILAIVTIVSLRNLPYTAHTHATAEGSTPVKVVDVVGYQYNWDFSHDQFQVGELIQFNVTSKDVNHGFGIYDPKGLLIAQTQAMPEYTNKVLITFDQPGTYKILCLEYCSIAHHAMIKEFVVEPK